MLDVGCLKSCTFTIFLRVWPSYLTFTTIISVLNERVCDGHLKKKCSKMTLQPQF